MAHDERRLEVLRAIVQDYVSSNDPVGSKALAERHDLGVSPATIRNDMAVLEEQGYITQPHTSAGRVPTDKGYRLFVDRLSAVKPLSVAERRAIERFLAGAVDLDDVVHRTVRLLAQLTRQVAVEGGVLGEQRVERQLLLRRHQRVHAHLARRDHRPVPRGETVVGIGAAVTYRFEDQGTTSALYPRRGADRPHPIRRQPGPPESGGG